MRSEFDSLSNLKFSNSACLVVVAAAACGSIDYRK